jgi:hypothetical protein
MAEYSSTMADERLARRETNATSQLQILARQLADDIIRQRDAAAVAARSGRVYTTLDATNDILANNISTVTTGLFTGGTGSLVAMHTQSGQTNAQNSYFRTVFDQTSTATTAVPQFSIAYGNFNGSGSRDTTGNLNNDTPSRAIYKQYAQILLPPNDLKFTINGEDTNQIYVLNFNRARFKEKLDPGNLEINLSKLSGSQHNESKLANGYTGSAVGLSGDGSFIQLIDDSSTASPKVGESGKIYNIVSGAIDAGTSIYQPTNPQYYGLLYPEHGIVVLDANKLNQSASFGTVTGSGVAGDNAMKLFTSLSGSDNLTGTAKNGGLQARSSEQVKSSYYFVRVKNAEYNYSNNPSFVTGSLGEIKFSTFVNDPQVYITTVGMYNTNRELLAVAKLSQPLLKNKTKEILIKVKLDF